MLPLSTNPRKNHSDYCPTILDAAPERYITIGLRMASLVRFGDSAHQCWSRVDLDSGEPIFISLAQGKIVVKRSNIGLMGPKLFQESETGKLARINHQLRRETQRRRETPCWAGWSKAGARLWEGCMRTYRPHRNPSPTPLRPASRKSQ